MCYINAEESHIIQHIIENRNTFVYNNGALSNIWNMTFMKIINTQTLLVYKYDLLIIYNFIIDIREPFGGKQLKVTYFEETYRNVMISEKYTNLNFIFKGLG